MSFFNLSREIVAMWQKLRNLFFWFQDVVYGTEAEWWCNNVDCHDSRVQKLDRKHKDGAPICEYCRRPMEHRY